MSTELSTPVTPVVQTGVLNAMTVDVEDWFQVSAWDDVYSRKDWPSMEWRVVESTKRLLELFHDEGIRATFFTLGCVAERFPQLIADMVAAGHELASHGYEHHRVYTMDAERFRADLARAKEALQAAADVPIDGFRAPSFSISATSLWAFDVLREEGYRYSSSVFPVRHDHYGLPRFPREPVRLMGDGEESLWELPMTTWRVLGRNLPVAGGGWMRALPPAVVRRGIRSVNRAGHPAITYLHPWEVDPDQPRVQGGSRKARFRHYLNLHKTLPRLQRLIRSFRFGTVSEVLAAIEGRSGASSPCLDREALAACCE